MLRAMSQTAEDVMVHRVGEDVKAGITRRTAEDIADALHNLGQEMRVDMRDVCLHGMAEKILGEVQ